MSHPISTVKARSHLKARREPYWHRISKGFYLGFRKMTPTSDGTWVIRSMDENVGKESYKSLGEFSELAPAREIRSTTDSDTPGRRSRLTKPFQL